jgi:uncharacterized protein (UPF0261 family)
MAHTASTPTIAVVGTLDTKGPETAFLADRVKALGCNALLMDVSASRSAGTPADISVSEVAAAVGRDAAAIQALPRGEAVALVSRGAALVLNRLVAEGGVQGIVGVGGSGGTTICTAAMRAVPYGVPKLMVSTLASGNTRWHVDISDIVMMPSLLDIGGLNPMLEMVLNNAAAAICGMARGYRPYQPSGKRVVALTMYGTTTPGVSAARSHIEQAGVETWVFHASGVGGRTMERLMEMGRIHAVMDMTLAEIGAHLVGGLHDAGPDRLAMAGALGLPQLIVPGACDTVVLPPRDQVPERFTNRTLNVHNPTMTTMRTNVDENVAIARIIAGQLNAAIGPVTVALPLSGLSSIDRPGKIFYSPEANAALFETLKAALSPTVRIVADEHHIDDPEFARLAGQLMLDMLSNQGDAR